MPEIHPQPVNSELQATDETLANQHVPELLQRLQDAVHAARDAVPGCDHAGVTLVHGGRAATIAASDKVTVRVDVAQYELGEGPCLTAAEFGQSVEIFNTADDNQFRSFDSAAQEIGVESVLSCPLIFDGASVGALNLYSESPSAYSADSYRAAAVIVSEVEILISLMSDLEDLLSNAATYTVRNRLRHDAAGVKTVLLVDDSPVLREALKTLLQVQHLFSVVAEACNGLEAIEAANDSNPDVVIMDLEMPLMSGWEALPEIVKVAPRTKVLIFSSRADADETELKQAGAHALISRRRNGSVMHDILAAVS